MASQNEYMHSKFNQNWTIGKWLNHGGKVGENGGEFKGRGGRIKKYIWKYHKCHPKIHLYSKFHPNRPMAKSSKSGGNVWEVNSGEVEDLKKCIRHKYHPKTELHTKLYPNRTMFKSGRGKVRGKGAEFRGGKDLEKKCKSYKFHSKMNRYSKLH